MATPTHSDRKPKESFQPPLVRCPFACFWGYAPQVKSKSW
jgi:hypothetical protein